MEERDDWAEDDDLGDTLEEDLEDADLEEEFPRGDGTAETETVVTCPYCGEANEISLDPGSGTDQEYDQDCEVCCRSWLVHVRYDRQGHADVEVTRADR